MLLGFRIYLLFCLKLVRMCRLVCLCSGLLLLYICLIF